MTIAATDREVKELIEQHHVYGAEVLINALVRAAIKQPYLTEAAVTKMIHDAYTKEGGNNAAD